MGVINKVTKKELLNTFLPTYIYMYVCVCELQGWSSGLQFVALISNIGKQREGRDPGIKLDQSTS